MKSELQKGFKRILPFANIQKLFKKVERKLIFFNNSYNNFNQIKNRRCPMKLVALNVAG